MTEENQIQRFDALNISQARGSRGLSILMTEGSSTSAREALYALGPGNSIDVLDPSALCQCRFSRFVRRWYRCSRFSEDPLGYLSCLGRQLRARRYDVIFSPHDEVYLLSRVRETLARWAAVALPDFTAVAQLQSKVKFVSLLETLKLPLPKTGIVFSRSELESWTDFPCYLKLDTGTAGAGVRMVQDRRELVDAIEQFERQQMWHDGDVVLMQKPANGRQATVRAVYCNGQLVGIHMNALIERGVGGAAIVRESCVHPVVIDHMRQLGEHLQWHGPLFAEYFIDEQSGSPAYIEANPRIGDTANATLSGANVCRLWVEVAMRQEAFTSAQPRVGFRSHTGMLALMWRAMNHARRRELVQEMKRAWAGSDIYEGSVEEMTRPKEDWLSVVPYAWVAARVLAYPPTAERIVRRTVERYALSREASERIATIPLDQLVASVNGEPA
jgi:predicted ATP-grasp superfamily ATP-dependent carboligase